IVIIGENVGILIGPEIFGFLREWTGQFVASFWTLSIGSLLLLFASLQIWRSGVFESKSDVKMKVKGNGNGLSEKV
ncbi:MAG TPA: hypothetical protein VM660_02030, partial [Bacillus sp. (in: firmicutes)]|nr:hypothetical protein [Bacillus sp. (in: firmicutes)]